MSRSGQIRVGVIVGVIALLGVAAGMTLAPRDFFSAYLFAAFFFLGISLGALGNLMVHGLTGGEWGVALRPVLLPAARLTPLLAVLSAPFLIGLRFLYPWTDPAHPPHSSWLQPTFFVIRSLLYLLVWSALAWRYTHLASTGRIPVRLSAVGLIVYGLTASLASIDWIMSLIPDWYSTGFALVVCTAQLLSGMSFGVAAYVALRGDASKPQLLNDFGNLLLMYVLTWMYLAFTQYLIIWAADLPREIAWYLPRFNTSWRWLVLAVFLLQFALPFLLLLFRELKRNARWLGAIAALSLAAQLLYTYQLIAPSIDGATLRIHWSDALALIAIGACWLTAWRVGVDSYIRRSLTREAHHA